MLKAFNNDLFVCGVDEAGRGCLAGPVTAAAVPTPILTANEVKLLFSVITKLPLNLTASLVNPTNLI